jgi:DNA-binding transcriptional LysR family regulator
VGLEPLKARPRKIRVSLAGNCREGCGVSQNVLASPGASWYGVELRHLLAFEAVARERSFSAAASSLGYTQSAVSGHMTRLEEVIGTKVFHRHRGSRGVDLTPEGEVLLEHVRAITGRLQAARADIESMKRTEREDPLRIGTFPSLSSTLLPSVLTRLAKRPASAEIEIKEDPCGSSAMRAVEAGQLDAAFTTLPLAAGPFRWTELFRDPYVLVAPTGPTVASEPAPVSLARMAELPIIAQFKVGRQQMIEDELRGQGVDLNVVARADTWTSIFALTQARAAFGFVPALSLSNSPPGLRMLALEPSTAHRTVVIAWHEDRLRAESLEQLIYAASSAAAAFCPMSRLLDGTLGLNAAEPANPN